MVSFSGDLPPLEDVGGPTSGSNHQISGMFSYLSSIREERDRAEAGLQPRRLITSSSSWGGESGGGGIGGGRSLWTKYCLLCTLCGSAATILAGIFLVVAALFRYYTTSINYFETVPTYLPAILLSICGVSTIAFSCKRNRNIILLRITACWSLCSAALSSVITITTSLIHMNRLQTLKECVYSRDPPSCSCYSHVFPPLGHPQSHDHHGVTTYVFENTPDCEVIHGILYSCLRAVFAISVVAVLLSIFLCMLLYQLIGHERKKAYWSRIRRINSDWSADFIACLARPMPRDRSSVLPLMMSSTSPLTSTPLGGWGPPPPYEEVATASQPRPFHQNNRQPLRLVTSHSDNCFTTPSPHPFSPTIALDPGALLLQRQTLSQGNVNANNNVSVTVNSSNPVGFSNSSIITSLSIPETQFLTSSNTLSTIEDDFEPPNASSLATCKSLASAIVFADSLEGDGLTLEELDLDIDLDGHIRLLDAELAKHKNAEGERLDKRMKKKNYSLPCSPLVRVKRLLFPRNDAPSSSSAHNLLSFANINWMERNLGHHHKIGEDSVCQVPLPTSKGTSLPNTPSRRNKKNNKLSLDEEHFLHR